jgi:hypothetical protein
LFFAVYDHPRVNHDWWPGVTSVREWVLQVGATCVWLYTWTALESERSLAVEVVRDAHQLHVLLSFGSSPVAPPDDRHEPLTSVLDRENLPYGLLSLSEDAVEFTVDRRGFFGAAMCSPPNFIASNYELDLAGPRGKQNPVHRMAAGETHRFATRSKAWTKHISRRPPFSGIERYPSSAQALRHALIDRVRCISGRTRPAVLLSGGLDSACVAIAAAHALGADGFTAVTLSWPRGARAFEAANANSITRRLGVRHETIALGRTPLLDSLALESNAARHPWFGWWLDVQRQLAARFDLVLMGSGAEWLQNDARQTLLSPARSAERLGARRLSFRASRWRTLIGTLTGKTNRGTDVDAFPLPSWTGKSMLLANPLAGRCTRVSSPFFCDEVYSIAKSIEHSGARLEKGWLRLAFANELSNRSLDTPRIGSTGEMFFAVGENKTRLRTHDEVKEAQRQIFFP